MNIEPMTVENTTIIMIDYGTGFANGMRSADLMHHLNNVLGLAELAIKFKTGFVVTNVDASRPSGPLYPQLQVVLGDTPVIVREKTHNVFMDDKVKASVRATGCTNVVIAGVSTDGCVMQSSLGALRESYNVYLAVDACATMSELTHDVAVMRLVQAGCIPVTWYSLTAEFITDKTSPLSDRQTELYEKYVPEVKMVGEQFAAAQATAAGGRKAKSG